MNILEIIAITLIFLLLVLGWFVYCIRNAGVNESENSLIFVSEKERLLCKQQGVYIGEELCKKSCEYFVSIENHKEVSVVECKLKINKIV